MIDVVAVGNAIVDVIARADDSFVEERGLAKGSMRLVDASASDELYAAMGPGVEMSGGSAANTAAGVASLGGSATFVGKVADDQLGEVFGHDIRASGVGFSVTPLSGGESTGTCLILVTPDAQRTMSTYLGAAARVSASDINADLVRSATTVYLEGYLFDPAEARAALDAAAEAARGSPTRVAFTLSDPFLVDRHRSELRTFIKDHVDVLFANEVELLSLLETDDLDAAIGSARTLCDIAAVTRSEHGSIVVTAEETFPVDVARVGPVVDTTGAGDLYAAGFLFALARGKRLDECGWFGSVAAAEVISHVGGRPQRSLADLVANTSPRQ